MNSPLPRLPSSTRNGGALLSLLLAASGLLAAGPERSFSADDVAEWNLHGIGDVEARGAVATLSEGADSKGVVLLTPESFPRDVVLRFRIRPNRHEGVLLALLAVSGVGPKELAVPPGHDGSNGFWNGPDAQTENFIAAFHTGYHQPEAFLRRNPGGVDLARKADPADEERWYDVELGRRDARVWLKIGGDPVLESNDPANPEVPGGQLGFRLRGPGDGSFAAEIRDVTVVTDR